MESTDIEKIQRASKDAAAFSENIKALDFELQQFNNFTHKIKKLKVSGIIWGAIWGLLIGVILAFFAQKQFADMYIEQQLKSMPMAKVIKDYGVETGLLDDGTIQIYTKKSTSSIWTNDNVNVLEVQK